MVLIGSICYQSCERSANVTVAMPPPISCGSTFVTSTSQLTQAPLGTELGQLGTDRFFRVDREHWSEVSENVFLLWNPLLR